MTDAILQRGIGQAVESTVTAPRLGFVGVGWIGRNRLQALTSSEQAEIAAVVDPEAEEHVPVVTILDSIHGR